MKLLNELLMAENIDVSGFVIINEGFASASVARARDIVAAAKQLATELDDKLEAAFRKELNTQLAAFNLAANSGDVRTTESKLADVEAVYMKYENKV